MKRNQRLQCSPTRQSCNDLPTKSRGRSGDEKLHRGLLRVLRKQKTTASSAEKAKFSRQLSEAIRIRKAVRRHLRTLSDQTDIIVLIQQARDAGNLNEAIWRCFFAAHFGRQSARGEAQVQSAARLLCAFRNRPFWTWKRVSKNIDAFEEWLFDCTDQLEALRFGNHRKYESPKPDSILETFESFVELVKEFGNPKKLLAWNDNQQVQAFHLLYKRLQPIVRFGRTARFDFLLLLIDLDLISCVPKSCYLQGATGPRKGAKLLWGNHDSKTLDALASQLSDELGLSPVVVEDALCNWQKD